MDDSNSAGSGLHGESRKEIDKFKWIESHRAGSDLGEEAVKKWVADHWNGMLRTRLIEHLEGSRYWMELDRDDFGILPKEFPGDGEVVKQVLTHLKAGWDNLGIICWAKEHRIACEPVLRILEVLDINGRRMRHLFDFGKSEPPTLPNPDVIVDGTEGDGPSPQ
jgi:hypothetical protein